MTRLKAQWCTIYGSTPSIFFTIFNFPSVKGNLVLDQHHISFYGREVELSYFKTRCLHSSSLKMMNWNGSFDNVDLRLGLLA